MGYFLNITSVILSITRKRQEIAENLTTCTETVVTRKL